jgi:hypothetical protein
MSETDRLYRLRDDIRYRDVAGEGVVLCQERGEVLVVNRLGVRIVALVEQGCSLATIVTQLLEEYDVDRKVLEGDVVAYIEDLRGAGVLDVQAGL